MLYSVAAKIINSYPGWVEVNEAPLHNIISKISLAAPVICIHEACALWYLLSVK